jgi:hypothetical protein
VPNVLRMDRRQFDAGTNLRPDFLAMLRKDALRCQTAGIREQVMLSFTTDPYHRGDTAPTRTTLETLIEHGLGMCTLTKGGTRTLRDLDLFRPTRDAFASTLTSLDDNFFRKCGSATRRCRRTGLRRSSTSSPGFRSNPPSMSRPVSNWSMRRIIC